MFCENCGAKIASTVSVKCKECGKEYQLKQGENPSDFQCECGGKLSLPSQNLNSIITKWKKTQISHKLFIIGVIVLFVVISGVSISNLIKQRPEDALIHDYESGASPTALYDAEDRLYNAEKENIVLNYDSDVRFVNRNYNGTERDRYLDYYDRMYQTSLKNLESIRTLHKSFIEGRITAEELKKMTYPLYQQTDYLKNIYKI